MRSQCAWCEARLPNKPFSNNQSLEETVSHSICLSCVSEMGIFEEIKMNKHTTQQLRVIPFGEALLDYNDKIEKFIAPIEVYQEDDNIIEIQEMIGKDFFRDVVPYLKSKHLSHKIGGLKRRKENGRIDIRFILRTKFELKFVQLEINHFVKQKKTAVKFELIREQKL